MVLILGALGAGKRAYVRYLGYRDDQISCRIEDDTPVLCSLEEIVRENPECADSLLEPLCKKDVVVCCEVGSGVIPISREERFFREQTGRLCVKLAKEADVVIRIVAGIPQIIKGV